MVTPSQLIHTWTIDSREISLFRDSESRLSFCDGGDRKTFSPLLYDTDYAIKLIGLFKNTIEANLKSQKPHLAPLHLLGQTRVNVPLYESCFLPKLCTDANGKSGIKVALFYHKNAKNELTAARWGVFDPSNNKERSFEILNDPVVEVFAKKAPLDNSPHFEPVLDLVKDKNGRPILDSEGSPIYKPALDKKGKAVMKEAADHYQLTAYAKQFRVFVKCDANEQITSIFLKNVSQLDRDVVIDEENWTVTALSTKEISRGWFRQLFTGDIGHAMLACEGVDQGKYFLRYIHFTPNPRDRNPALKDDEAQIEIFGKSSPFPIRKLILIQLL